MTSEEAAQLVKWVIDMALGPDASNVQVEPMENYPASSKMPLIISMAGVQQHLFWFYPQQSFEEMCDALSAMLGENAPRVDSIVGSMNRITADLADSGFAQQLSDAVGEVNDLLARIGSGEGTVGKLLNDAALYDSLTEASDNLASLLANLEQYPGRYVHFSLFGRSPEKMQEKAERKAAKAAARAERDSVKRIKN